MEKIIFPTTKQINFPIDKDELHCRRPYEFSIFHLILELSFLIFDLNEKWTIDP